MTILVLLLQDEWFCITKNGNNTHIHFKLNISVIHCFSTGFILMFMYTLSMSTCMHDIGSTYGNQAIHRMTT